MLDNMDDKDFKELLDRANEIAKVVAKTLIAESDGKGHILTAALAMVMAGLERQHKGTIKDVMAGAVLLGIDLDNVEEDVPPDNKLN